MLKFFKRLLGWDAHPTALNPEGVERRRTARTSVSAVFNSYPAPQAKNKDAEAAETELGPKEPQLSMTKPGADSDDGQDAGGSVPIRRLG